MAGVSLLEYVFDVDESCLARAESKVAEVIHERDNVIVQMRHFAQGAMDPLRYREPVDVRRTR
jgi:hypothetical protein